MTCVTGRSTGRTHQLDYAVSQYLAYSKIDSKGLCCDSSYFILLESNLVYPRYPLQTVEMSNPFLFEPHIDLGNVTVSNSDPVSKPALTWLSRYEDLEQYKEIYGHCNVPSRHGPLGRWVEDQRKNYRSFKEGKSSPMTDDRIRLLQAIGFLWTTANYNEVWDTRFQELNEFKAKRGHCNARPYDDGQLGHWVHNQRRLYRLLKRGDTNSLTDDRIQKLESIGFQWTVAKGKADMWDIKLEELKNFKQENGDCHVPTRYGPLGTWVARQRRNYWFSKEGKSSHMTDDRIRKLESIGFEWVFVPNTSSWDIRFQELLKYKEMFGHCNVPTKPGTLGRWVVRQRHNYWLRRRGKASPLSDDRIRKLMLIGFQWVYTRREDGLPNQQPVTSDDQPKSV